MEFLHRFESLIGETGVKKIQEPVVAIGGLGGTGGPLFVNLLRMGVSKFKIADNGVFNAPDMNRQPGARISTMNREKVDVYYEIARDINPAVEIEVFSEGLSMENIEGFVKGSDLFARMFNFNVKNMEMDLALPAVLSANNCISFTSCLLGFGTIMYNYRPGDMPIMEALNRLAQSSTGDPVGGMFPEKLFEFFNPVLMKKVKEYVEVNKDFPSSSSGAQLAGSILSSEMAFYLLRDTEFATRDAIFGPRFVTVDFFDMALNVWDATSL